MTATVEEKKPAAAPGGIGRVARVIGPEVDVTQTAITDYLTEATTWCARSR